MDLTLTDNQKQQIKSFAQLCADRIAPQAAGMDARGEFAVDNLKALAEFEYVGAVYPEQYGGRGGDAVSAALLGEELAKSCPSTFATVGASEVLFGLPILRFGSDELKAGYLPRIAAGEILGCFALTEPGAGSDVRSLKTRAEKKGDGWLLNGTKTFITNGPIADCALVTAVTDPEAGHRGLSMFVVDKQTPGFTAGEPIDKMGLRGSPISDLVFEDCEIPGGNLVGEQGAGFVQAMKILEYGRVGAAVLGVGIAQACMEDSIAFAMERKAFGKKIAQYQEVHFKIAEMKTMIESARLIALKAAWMNEQGLECNTLVAAAKLYASEMCNKVSNYAVQIHGGYGYIKKYRVERLYRDTRFLEIGEGTSEMMRMILARDVLDSV